MTEPAPPMLARSSSRRRRRSSLVPPGLARLLAGWWAEILIGVLLSFGIFLLFERMSIRQTLLGWLQKAWSALARMAGVAQDRVLAFFQSRTLSDLVGFFFLAAAVLVIAWRVRWRLLHSARYTDRVCPRCGSALHRVHRHELDRVLNLLVPVRRYRCDSQDCRWKGLRVGRGHQP